MKKLLLILMAFFTLASANAQGFYAGVESSRLFKRYDLSPNWDVEAFVSYSRPLFLQVGFEAQAGLYTQYFDSPAGSEVYCDPALGYPKVTDSHAITFGGNLGLFVTLKIAGPISLFTGPSFDCDFVQRVRYKINGKRYSDNDFANHRAMLQWRLGAIADIWKLRLKLSWDYDVTRRLDFCSERQSAITLSVAYNI